jgi:hypothetical protein
MQGTPTGLDFVDLVLEGLFGLPRDSDDFVRKPHPVRNRQGQPLSFASLPDLARATIHYAVAKRRNDYQTASSFLSGAIQTLESVRRDHAGLHSFLSMSLIEARRRNASAFRLRFSQSLARRLHRPSHANVRSTTHRFGRTTNPFA